MTQETVGVRLVPVASKQLDALKVYVEALYEMDEEFDSMVNIDAGLQEVMRNESMATAYFISQGDKRVGYVILSRFVSVDRGGLGIYIDELYVEEHHRRQKIGHDIMEQILKVATEANARVIWAKTEPSNLPAQAFFTHHGFVVDPQINFERPLG